MAKVNPAIEMIEESAGDMQKMKEINSADEALKALQSADGREHVVVDEGTNKRLLRIIDTRLLPMMFVIYGIQFGDKLVLSYAAVMGMVEDVRLKGNDYQWLGGVFYLGYLAWEYPTNRLAQRLPLAKYTAFCIVTWGAVQCAHAGIFDFPGAVVARIFLGAFEASITPCFAYITAQWYTKEEQNARMNIWFSANGVAQTLGGFIAYGLVRGVGTQQGGFEAWRWLYIVTGLVTILLGVVFYWHMPDNQLNARWMEEQDRILAVYRIRENQQGIGNKTFKKYQFTEALKDPMAWAFALYACVTSIAGGGLSSFFSQLIESFGWGTAETLLLGTPCGVVLSVTSITNGIVGARINQRILFSSIGLWLAILGMLLVVCLPTSTPVGRLVGYYLCWSMSTGFVTILSLIGTNIAGYTKKTTVAAMYLIGYCLGYFIGPQTFQGGTTPRWVPAQITAICCWAFGILDLYFILCFYRWQNRKRAAIRNSPEYIRVANQEFLDLTDHENPDLVYIT